jgi:secreted PhoX family phosphatase
MPDTHLPASLESEDVGTNTSTERRFADIVESRMSRRLIFKGLAASALVGAMGPALAARDAAAQTSVAQAGGSTLTFTEIPHGPTKDHMVANGYTAKPLIRWGDPVVADAPKFDPRAQTAAAQAKQFGYNNDFVAYMPLPIGSNNSESGLLWVNHEYTEAYMMFSGLKRPDVPGKLTKDQVDVEMAAHGGSIIEVKKTGNAWEVVNGSRYNRRIHLATEMTVSGPAAGHARLKTKDDPTGMKVLGTVNNCGGGTTPWGTVLAAEENFNGYFGGDPAKTAEAENYKRYGFSARARYGFSAYHDRFHVEKEPNEGNRFGWIVEIDPYEPNSTPVKRTALGRFKHEAATTWVNPDGTVTVYTGDDERNDYLYKFVTRGRYNPADRAANRTLLDDGTLYVAQFSDDGMVKWLPLVHGQGPLSAANGFTSQADVLIEARKAGDLLKATPLDRPEDVETNPVNGRTYVLLTNNTNRRADQVNKANPRANNEYGHILELIVPGDGGPKADHAVLEHKWDMFLIAGPLSSGAKYGPGLSASGWTACPDNICFDPKGRLWIASDQGEAQPKFGIGDGIWATDTVGPGRAVTKFFYRAPTGAEMCGPCFTPDGKTLFVAPQHPAADDSPESTFDNPTTRWPDFNDAMPPRPAVVAITKNDGGEIGA